MSMTFSQHIFVYRHCILPATYPLRFCHCVNCRVDVWRPQEEACRWRVCVKTVSWGTASLIWFQPLHLLNKRLVIIQERSFSPIFFTSLLTPIRTSSLRDQTYRDSLPCPLLHICVSSINRKCSRSKLVFCSFIFGFVALKIPITLDAYECKLFFLVPLDASKK